MSAETRMRAQAAPYLDAGEIIQAVFGAGERTITAVVVATNKRIIVFNASQWMLINIKGVRKELPRDTRFGTPHGLFYPVPAVGPTEAVVRKFFKGVIASDTALSETQPGGPA